MRFYLPLLTMLISSFLTQSAYSACETERAALARCEADIPNPSLPPLNDQVVDAYCWCSGGPDAGSLTTRAIYKTILMGSGRSIERLVRGSVYQSYESCMSDARGFPEC